MSNEYFTKALQSFTSDYAYGSQIRHLYEQGLSTPKIKEKLDYPVDYETVCSYLWEYLKKSKRVVFAENEIPTDSHPASYKTEYDSYGRKTFRLQTGSRSNTIEYRIISYHGNVIDISGLLSCYAHMDFSESDSWKGYLESKQIEYLSGLPFPKTALYVRLTSTLADIINTLYKKDVWHDVIISPDDKIKYIL